MVRNGKRALLYIRRSTDQQELSLANQLEWGLAIAARHGLQLNTSSADLEHMQANHLHSYKGLRLDDGVTGADLNRPGFLALNQDALDDHSISHVLVFKRDRFARAQDSFQAALLEKQLRLAGISVVTSDGIGEPIQRGEQSLMQDLEMLIGHHQGGEELRKHAERVLGAQTRLARAGYRTGGNAPYGFARVLVDATGNILEELPPGKRVRQPGCHVRVAPRDADKIAVWLQILDWKAQGWGFKRIARELNERGIPSPDARRTRTDHGVKHRVSGKWSPGTVAELCRNPIIIGIQEYGRRSEGKIRRLGADGPRLLDDSADLTAGDRPRVVFNDPSLRIACQVSETTADVGKWHAVQHETETRGRQQRGVPRAKDLARYPLSCRLVDLTDGCGAFLYGRQNQGRLVYTCGRYMRTASSECHSNQVDGDAMLRFTLGTLRQLVDRHGSRERLRHKLLERALRESQGLATDAHTAELARLRGRQAELAEQRTAIEYRLARERDDDLYAALGRQYRATVGEATALGDTIRRLEAERKNLPARTPQEMADAALAVLDDVERVAPNAAARVEVYQLLRRLGIRIGLTFGSVVKGKKRVVQRLLGGRMVFGDAPLPVPPYGRDYIGDDPRRGVPPKLTATRIQGRLATDQEAQFSAVANAGQGPSDVVRENGGRKGPRAEGGSTLASAPDPVLPTARPIVSQPEGISTTKDYRGDWIRTSDLLNPILGVKVGSTRRISQVQAFWKLTVSTHHTFYADYSRKPLVFPHFPGFSLPKPARIRGMYGVWISVIYDSLDNHICSRSWPRTHRILPLAQMPLRGNAHPGG